MVVKLLHYTPLPVAVKAIRTCWDTMDKSDTSTDGIGTKDLELIDRVANKYKHESTIEHLVYTFDISGISRALLQELARHRIASYSVKSTRYTLKELRDADDVRKFLVSVDPIVDNVNTITLRMVRDLLKQGISNDIVKYTLPEAYKTEVVMTINARSLRNLLTLRSSKSALQEFQDLVAAIKEVLPSDHIFLFEGRGNV